MTLEAASWWVEALARIGRRSMLSGISSGAVMTTGLVLMALLLAMTGLLRKCEQASFLLRSYCRNSPIRAAHRANPQQVPLNHLVELTNVTIHRVHHPTNYHAEVCHPVGPQPTPLDHSVDHRTSRHAASCHLPEDLQPAGRPSRLRYYHVILPAYLRPTEERWPDHPDPVANAASLASLLRATCWQPCPRWYQSAHCTPLEVFRWRPDHPSAPTPKPRSPSPACSGPAAAPVSLGRGKGSATFCGVAPGVGTVGAA